MRYHATGRVGGRHGPEGRDSGGELWRARHAGDVALIKRGEDPNDEPGAARVRVGALVETSVTRLFDRTIRSPLPIHTDDDALDQLTHIANDRQIVGGSAAAMVAMRMVRRSARVAKWVPSARLLALAASSGTAVVQIRNGIRELEVLTSLAVQRRLDLRVPVVRDEIVIAVLSAYLGRPVPSASAAMARLTTKWVGRAVRPDSDKAARRKAERWVAALK
jgi:hypothetical protein